MGPRLRNAMDRSRHTKENERTVQKRRKETIGESNFDGFQYHGIDDEGADGIDEGTGPASYQLEIVDKDDEESENQPNVGNEDEDEGIAESNRQIESFCGRMSIHEGKLVFLSTDRKETHFFVPLLPAGSWTRRGTDMRTKTRDFILLGFRKLQSGDDDQGTTLVGWCNAEQECPEPSYRRTTFPESNINYSSGHLLGFPDLCPCAKHFYDTNQLYIEHALDAVEDQEVSFGDDVRVPRILEETWQLAGNKYKIVNLNAPYDIIFNQWGVSKITADGQLSCKMCKSTPRHCAHNKALLSMSGGVTPEGHSPQVGAEDSISRMLNDDKSDFEPPCISRKLVPFFEYEDNDVALKIEGMAKML